MITWDNTHQLNWSPQDVIHAYADCTEVYEILLIELTSDLNEYHSIGWTANHYRKLLGNWLLTFVQISYDRWLGCRPLPRSNTVIQSYIAVDHLDYVKTYQRSDEANRCYYQQLAEIRYQSYSPGLALPSMIDCVPGFDIAGDTESPISIHGPYHSYGRFGWRHMFPRKSFPRQLDRWASPITVLPRPVTAILVDETWRLGKLGNHSTSFIDACRQFVRVHLPLVFLEGFSSIKQSMESVHVHSLFTSISTDFNIAIKYLAAMSHGSSPVFIHQHGGNYGIDKFCQIEDYDRSISDRFYTWGWKEDETTRPLPTPPRIQSWRISPSTRILLICGNDSRYLTRLGCYEIGAQVNILIDRTIKLVQQLKILDIEISHYPGDYGWNMRNQFADAGVSIPEKSMRSEYYGLHIINYLGAAWLESISANIPTICVIDTGRTLFRDSFTPYAEELFQVGILHDSVDSATAKVFEVSENPLGWWSTDAIQDIRDRFVQEYARMEDTWLDSWVDEFRHVTSALRKSQLP